MPHATPQDLYAALDALQITHETIVHPPVFKAEDEGEWKRSVPALLCKNLFMENKQGQKFLIVMPAFERAQLNPLFKQLDAGRLSFCKGEDMLPVLGVAPGHATPLALMNETAKEMIVAVDRHVAEADAIGVHPLHNAATTILSGPGLLTFLRTYKFEPVLVDTY